MYRFRIRGSAVINVYTSIEAETEEEALIEAVLRGFDEESVEYALCDQDYTDSSCYWSYSSDVPKEVSNLAIVDSEELSEDEDE